VPLTDSLAAQIKAQRLTPGEYDRICELMGRAPNPNELGMFGVMWSEHCCYKNSKPLLKGFPTTGPRVLVGPGENAGVVDFGEGLRIAFKIESHNHPSAVEPYQGAATGVGGILRDIFTMGARPIALLNSLRFGPPDTDRNRFIIGGVVAGIGGYGNSVGVPTVGGEVYFDRTYDGNPLVNALAIGLMELPEIMKSGAKGVGNPVIYVGSTTGRDGMGGASFASAELSDQSEKDRPAVQVGDPFLEKLLIEACLEAFQTGAVVAAQDMGAAGLTCSTCEMAAKGGVGVSLDLDLVPVREQGMSAYEYLLSESQERMLLVGELGREGEIIEIFTRWGLQAVVVGAVLADPVVRVYQKGTLVAEVPALALTESAPVYHHAILKEPPAYVQTAWAWQPGPEHLQMAQPGTVLRQLLASPTISSKQWIYHQYDYLIQNNSLVVPGAGDAAVLRVRAQGFGMGGVPDLPQSGRGLAATVDCNSRLVYLDPYEGAKLAVAEAARNLSCVGAIPVAVTDNLNFGSPERPEIFWQLAESCRGISDACRALDTPVTGGNVSLYNETQGPTGSQAIYPTPTIGMVGLVEDLARTCTLDFKQAGDLILLLGPLTGGLGGSEYLAVVHGLITGRPVAVDLAQEKRIQQTCRYLILQGWARSAHDGSEGGLAIALAESAFPGGLGATINLPANSGVAVLFGEAPSRIIVSIRPQDRDQVLTHLNGVLHTGEFRWLGTVGGTDLTCTAGETVLFQEAVADLQDLWSHSLERRMTGGLTTS